MANKYNLGKRRISIAGSKEIQNKAVSITDKDNNDVFVQIDQDFAEVEETIQQAAETKLDAPAEAGETGQVLQLDAEGKPQWVTPSAHFKGWWPDLATLKTAVTAVPGDYAYVEDASPATTASIYVYDSTASSDNYWADSGMDVDSSGATTTFASGQSLNSVDIVNDLTTGGTEDVLSAEQGKVLKQEVNQLDQEMTEGKLYIEEIRSANIHNSAPATVSNTQPTDGSDWAAHYIQGNGIIVPSSDYNSSYFIEVSSNNSYKSNIKLRIIQFYNNNKELLGSSYIEDVTADSEIQIPTNAVYVRFSYKLTQASVPSAVKFGKYTDNINVDYSVTYIDRDFYGNQFLHSDSPLDGNKLQEGTVTDDKLQDNTITNEKLKDGTITNEKIKYPLPIVLSNNLFDKSSMVADGFYINTSGVVKSLSGWACTDYIEIEPNTDYYFYAQTWGRRDGYVWYNENKTAINPSSTGDSQTAGVHTSPSTAKYVRFNLKQDNVDSVNVMLAKSSVEIPYVDYGIVYLPTSAIKDFQSEVISLAGINNTLNVVKNGTLLRVYANEDYVDFNLESNSNNYHAANPVCNIYGRKINGVSNSANDEIAPMHILAKTFGGNHAQPIQAVTITSHGFLNQDIGREFIRTSDNTKFYIVRIVSSDVIWMLSENLRTYLQPLRNKLVQGDVLSDGTNTYTVESVVDAQMYPGLKNHIYTIYCNEQSISENGTYPCNKVSICEQYEIMNPESVLQNLISNVGSSEDPIYDGNSAVRVENIYTFDKSITMTVLTTVVFLEGVYFSDIMSTQLSRKAPNYYIPNSLPIASGVDLRVPTNINWSSSIPTCNITQDKVSDTTYPINRVLQYDTSVGYAIGYLHDSAIMQKLNKYTSTYFEIRNDTGKVYPHPIDSIKTSDYQQIGNIYQTLMYVAPFVPEPSGSKRLSVYTVNNNNIVYVYVDYIDSVLDKVIIDSSLNGKKITVLESSNAELISMDNNSDDEVINNTYNQGFYINANYVSGETCYMVLKIE